MHKLRFIEIQMVTVIVFVTLCFGCSGQPDTSKPDVYTSPNDIFFKDHTPEPVPTMKIPPTPYPSNPPLQFPNDSTSSSISNPSEHPSHNSQLSSPTKNNPNVSQITKKGGILKLASKNHFESTDPHENYSSAYATWGIGVIYQRIMKFKSGPEIILPSKSTECDVCESWKMLDSKTFLFEIDTNNKWHSRESEQIHKMSVEDIKFSLDRLKSMSDKNSNRFHMIRDVELNSQTQIQINLNAPDADFLIALGDGRSKLVSKSDVENSIAIDSIPPVGSGPWKISKFTKDSYAFLENTYSSKHIPYLDSIEFHILPDHQTRLSAYKVGLIDVHNIEDYSSAENITFEAPNTGQGFEIAFNTSIPPFNDYEMRYLAQSTLNPDEIINKAWNGQAFFSLGFSTNHPSWIPKRSLWEPHFFPFIEREYLNESVPIDITTSDFGLKYKNSVALASQHLEAVGFDTTVNYVNKREYVEQAWNPGDSQIYMGPTFPHSSPNEYIISVLHSNGAWNNTNHEDSKLDSLIESQSQEYVLERRSDLINEINTHLLEQSYRIMPATQKDLWSWTQDLKNMHPNFSGFEYSHWENVWLDR